MILQEEGESLEEGAEMVMAEIPVSIFIGVLDDLLLGLLGLGFGECLDVRDMEVGD